MAETPTYNHSDIKRYLQHMMSPQEMHAFEKALMDDPFLADAMEGFATADATLADRHLAGIEEQLTIRKEKARVVPLVTKRTTWWKAAVIVMIVGTGGFLSYLLLYKHEDAIAITQQISADRKSEAPAMQDSVTAVEKSSDQEIAMNKDQPALGLGRKSYKEPSATAAKAPPQLLSAAKPDSLSSDPAANVARIPVFDDKATAILSKQEMVKPVSMQKLSSIQVLHEFKGKVTDISGEPVPFATIIDSSTHTGTVTDANGSFVMKVSDTITKVMVNDPGYAAHTATISSKAKLNSIVLETGTQSFSEVVVGYGAMKRKIVAAPDSSGTAEPVGGWKSFGQYLNRQIDSLQAGDSKDLYSNQHILLEFSIDQNGNPSDIQVKELADKAVARKAIEILSNGPKWTKKKKDKKVKVVIPFGQVK